MRRKLALAATMSLAFGMVGSPALAHHGTTAVVPPHQHLVNGEPVGPDACSDGQSIQFDHFHMRVHLGEPGGMGVVTSAACG